ncbi:MAG: extensin family protein [bacterium]
MATPVLVTGPLNGLKLRSIGGGKKPALMACKFAMVLYSLAPLIQSAGFDELRYSSTYMYRRVAGRKRLSKHAFGLAIDVHRLLGPGGRSASVLTHWRRGASACGRPVSGALARRLQLVYCRVRRSPLTYWVIGPDYNRQHHNHFHISAQ